MRMIKYWFKCVLYVYACFEESISNIRVKIQRIKFSYTTLSFFLGDFLNQKCCEYFRHNKIAIIRLFKTKIAII